MGLTQVKGVYIYGNMIILTSQSPEETQQLAHWMAKYLEPQALALVGTLGMGKTCFAKGFLSALDVDEADVSSPTFAIIHEYDTAPSVLHLDLYRLEIDDLPNLALDERIDEQIEDFGGFVLVEWANKHPKVLPPNAIWIEFTEHGSERQLRIEATSAIEDRLLRFWDSRP